MKTHICRSRRAEAGFSIVEMLIPTAIMMVVTAATFGLMNPAHGMFAAQPEVSDMQQRLRIAADALTRIVAENFARLIQNDPCFPTLQGV